MNKQFIAIIVIVVAALVGLFAFTQNGQPDSQNNGSSQGSNHTVGAGNKKVTLVEYGDFQCPACKSYYPLVKQVKETYGDDITFQFRHFPLVQIHPNAMLGSRAAEAAGKQGKFFEMHDLLYENQEEWAQAPNVNSILEGYARQLDLNLEQFRADLQSGEVSAAINADIKAGQSIGATSTPTFVINGRKIEENPRTLDDFKKLIDEEITRANQQ